ncbi:MAG: hypothetical protein FD167_1216 [bacterium]|nr:MAG: hypothetical protein FD167_1216 [bacterium]
MGTVVKLNFINNSNDSNNSEIVIFQKNVSTGYDELAVAWTVIENCGVGDNHPFTYPLDMNVSASDSYGNFTPQLLAYPGQAFEVILDRSGDVLVPASSPSASPKDIEVRNSLTQGSINACVYRDGKLLAAKTNIVPLEKAVFQFKPTIWIGVAAEIEEGQVMNSAILSLINTEINLLGVASADIVMTGGGAGSTSKPYTFKLMNVRNL